MILVANGCSHTAGAEIDYPSQGESYEKAWPKHLSDLLNCSSVNLSMSGASNHRVVRTTLEFIYDYKCLKEKDLSDLFFIIMWPGLFRTELHSKNSDTKGYYDNDWCPLVVGNDELYKDQLDFATYNYYKSWVVSHDRHKHIIDFHLNVILLQNIFTRYKIKYMFWNASRSILQNQHEFNPYKMHIDKKYYPKMYETKYCYTDLCRASGQTVAEGSVSSGNNSHYDEAAHKWFASFLYKYLRKSNIL